MNEFVYNSTEQRQLRRLPRDLIRARELLRDLVSKNLRVRYRYAVMGFLWAIFEPLALMLVLTFIFTFIFSGRAPVSGQENTPYAVSLLCGLIFWQFTATALTSATQSLIDNQNLVKKVHFPREIIPIAATGYPLVNLGIGFVILLALHVISGGIIRLSLLYFCIVFGLHLAALVGLATLLACANVLYRDIGYMTSVAVVFGFYASPVFYPLEFVVRLTDLPAWVEPWYPWLVRLYLLNPMAELLTAYRQILFECRFPDLWLLAWPSVTAVVALGLGAYVCRRTGPTLSDYL